MIDALGPGQKVTITIVEAELIKDHDILSKMDPYVVVKIGDERFSTSYKTAVAKGAGKHPVWNFKIDYTVSLEDKLAFDLKDHERSILVKDDFIGRNTVKLSDLIEGGFGVKE